MYDVILSSRARSELHRLSWKYQELVIDLLLELRENPTGKSLERELRNHIGERVGVYRIVYKIHHKDKKILITRIGHRSKVYI